MEKRDSFRSEAPAKENDTVPETGCLSIIVLGASGDLAKKKTFPALFHLYRQVRCSESLLLPRNRSESHCILTYCYYYYYLFSWSIH